MGADDGVSARAGIDLASQKSGASFDATDRHAPRRGAQEMFNPRNKSYVNGIILRDLVSLQARQGRLPGRWKQGGLPLNRCANHGHKAISR